MYHVLTLLQQIRVAPNPSRRAETSRKPDQIVAPGSLRPFCEDGSDRDPETLPRISALPRRLVVLAGIELLLPAAGLLLGLQLWNGSLWWLLTGAGIVLSVLVGYIFRSHVQLHPLDLSH